MFIDINSCIFFFVILVLFMPTRTTTSFTDNCSSQYCSQIGNAAAFLKFNILKFSQEKRSYKFLSFFEQCCELIQQQILDHVVAPKIALISKVTSCNIFIRVLSFSCHSNKIKSYNKKQKAKEIIKLLIYDCFHVIIKITPSLGIKVALFYGTSLFIHNMLVLSVLFLLDSFMWKMRATQRW